ncbi:MAG: HupE/UreJ family protein [Cyanobium sp.]
MTRLSLRGAGPKGRPGFRILPALLVMPGILMALALLAPAAQAHHVMELLHLRPTPLTGLISGLAHPLLGPDHLLFLLALALVGLKHRLRWMLALLTTGLIGSGLGLVAPGLPGSEALVSLSLVAVGLVLLDRLPAPLLLPAFAVHGYALSASVLGWTSAPVAFYLAGLLISQGALLLFSLTLLRKLAVRLGGGARRLAAAALMGCGAAWTWSALVG